jgi:ATP-dependent DNA helicase RecQ
VTYLIDVLRGKSDERLASFGHDLDVATWRGVFRQLIAHGLLAVDLEGYGRLHLTDACRPVLRGEQPVLLRREIKSPAAKKARTDRTARTFIAPTTKPSGKPSAPAAANSRRNRACRRMWCFMMRRWRSLLSGARERCASLLIYPALASENWKPMVRPFCP